MLTKSGSRPGAYSPLALGSISAILLRRRTNSLLLRRRTNSLLELFDSLRCSYLIRYAVEEIPGMTAGFAANYLTGTMVCFFIGRFTGTWLISRFAVPGSSVASHHTKSWQPTH